LAHLALVLINIIVGLYALAVITATAIILSLNAQRPLEEQGQPLFGDGPSKWLDSVFSNDLVIAAGWIAIAALIVGFIALLPEFLSERSSDQSFLVSFPGVALGLKLVGPLSGLFLIWYINNPWLLLTAVVVLMFMSMAIVSVLLARLSKWGGQKPDPAIVVADKPQPGTEPSPFDTRHRLHAQA